MKKEDDVHLDLLKASRKRRNDGGDKRSPKKLKIKVTPSQAGGSAGASSKGPLLKLSLKLGPKPPEPEAYPCCLCISANREGLLRVYEPPVGRKDVEEAAGRPKEWLAHEYCASVVPETWVDEIEHTDTGITEKVVFGVDGIVKDRWNLVRFRFWLFFTLLTYLGTQKCSACTKSRPKAHGAPIQCTKGKCPKAFHVSCARDGAQGGVVFSVVREVEKEVVLLEPSVSVAEAHSQMEVDVAVPEANMEANAMTGTSLTSSRVLKIIKKYEVQVLCPQHNPVRFIRPDFNLRLTNMSLLRRPWLQRRKQIKWTRLRRISWHFLLWPVSRYALVLGFSRCR